MSPIAAVVLALAAVAHPAQPSQPLGQLAIFSPLVGRDWVAEFPGNNVTDTQRFEWVLGARFLRNVHHVRAGGKVVYEGETIYAWDQRAQRIVWWYWNSTGGYVTGTIAIREDGAIATEGENHGPSISSIACDRSCVSGPTSGRLRGLSSGTASGRSSR